MSRKGLLDHRWIDGTMQHMWRKIQRSSAYLLLLALVAIPLTVLYLLPPPIVTTLGRDTVAIIIGVFLGIVASVMASLIVNLHQRPLLKYTGSSGRFRLKQLRRHQFFEDVDVHRLNVTNSGRTVARDCRAKLTLRNVKGESSFDLCWVGLGNPQHVSIYPDEDRDFDLYGSVTSRIDRFKSGGPPPLSSCEIAIPTSEGWRSYTVIGVAGVIEGEFTIYAANASPEKRSIRIVPLGVGKTGFEVTLP